MPGVISLLPSPYAERIEALWQAMHERFGVPLGYPGAVPHITFHLGAHDVAADAATVVEAVAARTAPFTIVTSGLGVFGGPVPVIHLAVARSAPVASLAADLDASLAAAGFPTTDPYFHQDRWMPHITIAHRNLAGIQLGPVLHWLVGQPLAGEVPLSSLSIARETDSGAEILATFPLLGSPLT